MNRRKQKGAENQSHVLLCITAICFSRKFYLACFLVKEWDGLKNMENESDEQIKDCKIQMRNAGKNNTT